MKVTVCDARMSLVTVLVLLSSAVFCGSASAVTQYTIADLGTLGGTESHAWNINSLGQVVGHARTASGDLHAFLWLPEQDYGLPSGMHDLGTLGGSYSDGMDINASGQVVGAAHVANGDAHAYLWESGVMDDLGTLGGTYGGGDGINASGQVVGCSWTSSSSSSSLGFVWLPESDYGMDPGMHALPTLGGTEGWALGVNGAGQVVGAADTSSGNEHAYVLDLESGEMLDIGTLGATTSWAYDINSLGQVVGWADSHAFLWADDNGNGQSDPGEMRDLGPGEAYSINESAQVVGQAGNAVLWEDSVMYDLDSLIPSVSGWSLTSAEAINDLGQIVGWGTHNGETHAFLLTPVPEPSVLGLVGLALIAAVRRVRLHIKH